MTNTIRPYVATSLRMQGEVQSRRNDAGKPVTLGEQQRSEGRARRVFGDGMHGRSRRVNGETCPIQEGRSLSLIRIRRTRRAGVRASIVAEKSGNADGAKGRRKVDERS